MSLDGTLDVTVAPDAVEFELVVSNVSSDPVDLEFSSGQTADFTVYADGEAVWRWSDDRMFTQMLRSETLAPDETLTQEGIWEDPPAGAYQCEASLAASNVTLVERTEFEV